MKNIFIEIHNGDNVTFMVNLAKAYQICPNGNYDYEKTDTPGLKEDQIVVWWDDPESDIDNARCSRYYGISYYDVRKLLTGK